MKTFIEDIFQNKNVLMLILTLSYVAGLFGYFTNNPVIFAFLFTLFSLVFLIKGFKLKLILLWLAVFYFSFFYADFRIKNFDELYKIAPVDAEISGQIVSVPNSNIKTNTKFFFMVDTITSEYGTVHPNNKTLVSVNNPDTNLTIGNTCKIKGKLRQPFISTNPSQFSYAGYLKNFQVYTTFYADDKDIIQTESELTTKWKMIQYLNNKRDKILKTHSQYMKSPNLEILGGVIFGDDAVAPPDYIKDSLIHSGLLHILAASGMNVAFISSFLFFFMIRLGVPYRIRMVCGILVTILYCLMTGLGASVVRAGLMLIFVLFGKLIDRDAHSISLLSFVALLMLLYNPAYINDVGFQLSFIVTFGILISFEMIAQYTKNNIPDWLSATIFIPVIAQLWVIPIQMFYFNTISIYSVFANILTMPLLEVISFGGFISVVLSLFEPIADFICKYFDFILNPCLNILLSISDFFAKLPHSLCHTTHPSIIQILLYYVILGLIIYVLKKRTEVKKLVITTTALILILVLSATVHLPNRNFEIISFDVGNADAFLLKTPQNKYFIIDTGKMGYNGSRSQADIIILKYLRDKGIKNIEGLIITHFDADHAGGAVDLINNLTIKNVYVNSTTDNKRIAKEIYKTVNKKNHTKLILAKNDNTIYSEENIKIKTIKADIPQHGHDSEANENSVMALIESYNSTFLFTGDAGTRAFENIKSYLPQNITMLKVGHHGAKDVVNKEMINYLNPEISLISVGYNKYGHPHPMTVKLLEKTKLVRTDRANAIKFTTNKHGWEIDGYDSDNRTFRKKYSKKF